MHRLSGLSVKTAQGTKTDVQSIAPSISAIFGFTLRIGQTSEVLTPDIYGAHWCLL